MFGVKKILEYISPDMDKPQNTDTNEEYIKTDS